MRVNYDDDLLEVIDKVNVELSQHELVFVDDGEIHDGFCVYSLEEASQYDD